MSIIILPLSAGLLLFTGCFLLRNTRTIRNGFLKPFLPCLLFLSAFFLRLTAAGFSKGFDSDTACFAAWADRIFLLGPGNFYSEAVFTDYPPGYMYLLYPIGALRTFLGIEAFSTAHLILLKLPSLFGDLLCGFLLYREALRFFDDNKPLLFCAAYLFNPVILLNSSVWGQVDSLYTLFLVLVCLCLVRGKTIPAYFFFCSGLLLKPQMLLIAPVLCLGILDQVFLKDFSLRKLLGNLCSGLVALSTALLLVLPFGTDAVLKQYLGTVISYPYASVNAYNLWGLFGLNWVSQDETVLGISYRVLGGCAIGLTLLLLLLFSLCHQNDRKKYPLLTALFLTGVFTCSVRMHERYLYPALLLLLFAVIYFPSKRLWLCYSALSLLHYCNTAHVLFFYNPADYDRKAPFILLVSAGTVALFLFLCHTLFRLWREPPLPEGNTENKPLSKHATSPFFSAGRFARKPLPSHPSTKLHKADLFFMVGITLLYSLFALYDLGDRQAPESALLLTAGDEISLQFTLDDGQSLSSLAYYIAPEHDRSFQLSERSDVLQPWSAPVELTFDKVFTWQTVDLKLSGNALKLTLKNASASILELVFLDNAGQPIYPENARDYPSLFDEGALFPKVSTFRNSMYFDEIYHGRTAYEFLHGLVSYENTHPPLGKLLISLGILLFGMNPFGWRIVGALIGILMVPVIYLFARKLTGRTVTAALACTLFTFDFMHFTQTRLATIDVFITFFVLLMYYFMYCYFRMSFYDVPLKKTLLPLGLSGICMGLGIASKWTGVYAGLGLAVIFFSLLLQRYREYLYAKAAPEGSTGGIPHRHILNCFLPHTVKTLLFCVLFFVILPALLYLLSYLPFSDGSEASFLQQILRNQETMFRYHSKLEATHPYASPWYQWPVMRRPIWYYSRIVTGSAGNGGLREGISAFGNPLVWWSGIPAALYTLYLCIRKKDRTAFFLLTGYLAQYLPWFFVTRVTFIYHYFPCVGFVVLMIVYSLYFLSKGRNEKHFRLLLLTYGVSTIALFLLFYPVLSGQPVDAAFVARFLRWFNSWVLCAT